MNSHVWRACHGARSTVSARAAIAAGRFDEGPNPARFAEPLAAALPRATLRLYPELSHFGPFEDPARIAADVITLADSATAAGSTAA